MLCHHRKKNFLIRKKLTNRNILFDGFAQLKISSFLLSTASGCMPGNTWLLNIKLFLYLCTASHWVV